MELALWCELRVMEETATFAKAQAMAEVSFLIAQCNDNAAALALLRRTD